ncbi:hypothetical protein [Photobacterium ganghwense]|uniref:hypothetical protein n=1 Tax=Photobacterium ganghwense TaxID=320778 RepID=UPI001C2DA8B0|nr:hypothetical protein [Photobacterium ganghwense]MBV1842699.1 hypothetical protein [Photobacterium ganghwense]
MTQNIEKRTEVAATKFEGASQVAHKLAHVDGEVLTAAGPRKSFPKVSREFDDEATRLKKNFSEESVRLQTEWSNESAVIREEWANERNAMSIKSLGVLGWEPGQTENNLNQQRRWTDNHTYLPKTVPALMGNDGPNDDWIPYSADKDSILSDVFGRKPVTLVSGLTLTPDMHNTYPKLLAYGKVWELSNNDQPVVVNTFSESQDGHLVVNLNDNSVIIAYKVDGASRNYVDDVTTSLGHEVVGGTIFPFRTKESLKLGMTVPEGIDAFRINDRIYLIDRPTENAGVVTYAEPGALKVTIGDDDYFIYPSRFSKVIDLISDVTVPNTVTLTISPGGGFYIPAGQRLEINGNIEADHHQIFFGPGDVVSSFYNTRSVNVKLGEVKAAWFGVKSDAMTMATYGTDEEGTNQLGDLPKGTDSTAALKKAARLAQYASFHGGRFLEISAPCPLVLPPKGQVIVKGNNPLGNQLFLPELAVLDSAADNGVDFKALPEFQVIRAAEYDYTIDYNGCTIFHVIENEQDALLSSTVLINRFVETGKGNIHPCGTTTPGIGRHLYNKAISQKGFENENYYNNLSSQEVDITQSVSGLKVSQSGTDPVNCPADYAFVYEGYSLGDRLRINGGTYRGLKGILKSNNPESVEINAEESDFRVYSKGAAFFEVSASFSQHKLERCGIFMKGDDQTVFRCRGNLNPTNDINRISRVAQFALHDCRIEGDDGYKKTLVDANYGEYSIRNIVTPLGMVAENDSSRIATLSGYATCTVEGGSLPGRVALSLLDIDHTNTNMINNVRSPMISLTGATLYNTHGIDKMTFNNKDYGYAILQDVPAGIPVPLVKFIDSPNESERQATQLDKNPMPPCRYYGTFRNPRVIDEFILSRLDSNGFEYVHDAVTLFPSYCVIEGLYLSKTSSTVAFKNLRLTIGDSQFTYTIADPASRKNLLLLNDRKISVQTSVESKRVAKLEWVDDTGNPIIGGTPPSMLLIKYRAIQAPYEIPAGNVGGSAVEI